MVITWCQHGCSTADKPAYLNQPLFMVTPPQMMLFTELQLKHSFMKASERAYSDCSNLLRVGMLRYTSYAELPHLSMSQLQGLLCPGQAWQRHFPQSKRVIVHHIPMVGASIRKQQRTRKHSQGEHYTCTTPLLSLHSVAAGYNILSLETKYNRGIHL